MAKNDLDRTKRGILGDINPTVPPVSRPAADSDEPIGRGREDDESMTGGSRHDQSEHSGSRDVTEGVTGGTGTEVGGTRNYRQGTGATGTDIGNRPE